MSKLMIVCPVSGERVFTGIEIEPHTLDQIPAIVARLICPACRQEHAWTKRDALLDDGATEGNGEQQKGPGAGLT